jgi:hypothetical protein
MNLIQGIGVGIGAGLVALLMLFIAAVLGGTIIWLVWPVAIPAIFPGLVAGGALAGKISWFAAVVFTWICAILFKPTVNTNK